jgi:3-hydroxymyristoyl/3-hydroxydecanoyl-(acyl carrier protein) dehydratase
MNHLNFDFTVSNNHPAIPGHFPGRPIVPGVLIIDKVLEGVHRLAGLELQLLKYVKFNLALKPGIEANVLCDIHGREAKFLVSATYKSNKETIASGKMILRVKDLDELDA